MLSLGKEVVQSFRVNDKQKYRVVAGALIPATDNWVGNKVGEKATISIAHRRKMCDLPLEEQDVQDWVETQDACGNAFWLEKCFVKNYIYPVQRCECTYS
uniref:Uncharacterized protein n=1 Tax=Aplanochytrium stocchinoi TaxID=215587 RepID=A0A7S3V0Z7_9STRA|mmetsp:Transcript_3537/g.4440  ORF Transcript_3537/g.4440 Transcript_3537/m.4440 type:complete len:100 (+) Transcript_3537:174-473(+)